MQQGQAMGPLDWHDAGSWGHGHGAIGIGAAGMGALGIEDMHCGHWHAGHMCMGAMGPIWAAILMPDAIPSAPITNVTVPFAYHAPSLISFCGTTINATISTMKPCNSQDVRS